MTYSGTDAYDPAMRGVVSGRDSELARLSELLADVAGSTARAAVIEGPAGIGKSTVLQVVADDAAARGFAVFSARSEEMERERSFGAVAGLVNTMDVEGATELAARLQSPPDEAAAFPLVDHLVDVLEGEALRRPVLISLDDVQWADDWSVRAVAILFRRLQKLPVALLVGARPSPSSQDLVSLIAALAEAGVSLRLGPLDDEAVAELVRAESGAAPAARLLRTLERAGGNPFFVRELYDALERDGMLVSSDESVDVAATATPPGLLVTVLHRMRSLTPEVLELVRTAAVLSGSFTVHQLAVASAQPAASLLAPLLSLRGEGILAEDGEQFRFRHDLLREAVYEDLGGPVRAAMHTRVGHAFAASGFDISEAARHLRLGAQPGDHEAVEIMIAASLTRGVTARETLALLRRVLELSPNHPDALELKSRLGSLLASAGSPTAAIPLLEEVLSVCERPEERLPIIDTLGVAALRCGDRAAMWTWRVRAAELAEELHGSNDPRTLLAVSQCEFDRGEFEDAHNTATRAATIAAETGNRAALEDAENKSVWLLSYMGRPRQALAHSGRALELARGRPSEAMRLIHHGQVRIGLWEDAAAAEALARARTKADEHGSVGVLLKTICDIAWHDYAAGRWEDAELHADTALQMIEEFRIATDAGHPNLVHAWIAFRRGDMELATHRQAGFDEGEGENSEHSRWLTMRLSLERADLAGAAAVGAELVSTAPKFPHWRFAENLFPEIARIGISAGNQALADEAAATAVRYAAGGEAPSLELASLRCAAIVERDMEAAEKALELGDACPWPLERAGAIEDAALVLHDRRDGLLATAEQIYERVGSIVDSARLQMARGGRPPTRRRARAATGWDALTEAEVRVVELAAEGLTNKEIGERLFVSHRTAGTHLAHAFDKLQVRSRVELARLAAARASSPV